MDLPLRRLALAALLALGAACDAEGPAPDGDGGDAATDGGDAPDPDATDEGDAATALVAIGGHAFAFGPPGGFVAGAEVTVLERPGLTATTDPDGAFRVEGLRSGDDATLVMSREGYAPIQTGTLVPGTEDLERVTFQAPTEEIFALMARLAGATPDAAYCQIASTVTRVGASLYGPGGSHGEAGATVTIDPPVPVELGPIYFNIGTTGDFIYPDRTLTETTEDGGVLFVNVEPGEYVLTAHKAGVSFTETRMKCRAGFLVNASPPWGLQAL